MSPTLSVVGGFFLRALLFLAPSLAVWYWARDWVVRPASWFAEKAMLWFFPSWVYGTEREGTTLSLLTAIRIPHPSGRVAELVPDANVLIYCYGLPLLAALLLAARARGIWWKLPLGAVVLAPFQAWGVCFAWLVEIAVKSGSVTAMQTGFGRIHADAFALGYQLGYLLLPTLIPLLLWLHFERRFITTVVVDGALEGSLR